MLENTKTKRQLTEEEEKVIKQLRKHFDDAEKMREKKLKTLRKK